MVVSEGDEIELQMPHAVSTGSALLTLEELERGHIRAVLAAASGNRAQTARILGISERNLYRKLRDLSLEY